jgi:uncharacterized protein (DUF4415 family)
MLAAKSRTAMDDPVTERKRTKAEERAHAELHDTLQELQAVELEMRLRFERLKFDHMPFAWAAVESRHPVRPKQVRINATYDEDVARFFRTMGRGYQARMNAVLRAYMLAILSRAIGSKRNEDWMGDEI